LHFARGHKMSTGHSGVGIGDRVGDYAIEAALRGGDYLAVHVLLPRRARLRIGAPRRHEPHGVMREACILEALRLPNVPRVFEVGRILESSGPRPWAAFEIIDGPSLVDDAQARPAIRDVIELVRDVADILAYSHRRGVAHRAVRLEAIVRGDRSCARAVCLVDWSEAMVPEPEHAVTAFADDVLALGHVADSLLSARVAAPPRLGILINEMVSPEPDARPSAAEVSARANTLLAVVDELPDDDVVEEQVVLVDIIARTNTPLPPRARTRWTPPIPLPAVPPPPAGVLTGLLKRRSD
jgi:hypothetical protein